MQSTHHGLMQQKAPACSSTRGVAQREESTMSKTKLPKAIPERKRGSHARTGTVVPTRDGRWQPMIRLADGSKMRLDPLPEGTSEAEARKIALEKQQKADRQNLTRPQRRAEERNTDECEAWVEVWIKHRESKGYTSVREDESHWRTHARKVLGAKHPRDWTRTDLRALRLDLVEKARRREVSWKTVANVWTTVSRMCADASEHDDPKIRVRDDDSPSLRLRAPQPDQDIERSKQFLYPSEFLKFVSCPDVPLRWRQLVAVAVYTYLREGELRVLRWADVDFEHRTIHVHRARDRRTPGGIKPTKGKADRKVPIEPRLAPLLEAMHKQGGPLVIPEFPSERDMARGLRRWLLKAGVDRAALHEGGETTQQVRFHDLRSTGCTWAAIRNDPPLQIQARAGHKDFQTTQGYIRTAEAVREGFGDAFPELPPELSGSRKRLTNAQVFEIRRGGRDLNPGETPEMTEEMAKSSEVDSTSPPPDSPRLPTTSEGVSQSVCHWPDARNELVQTLNQALGRALAAGDLEAARVAHEAIGKLMGSRGLGGAAPVVDLNAARRGRGNPSG
jgi:integrase